MNNGSAQPIERVSIIVSHGSLEGVYPGLIMANGARMEGIEASLFFTFFVTAQVPAGIFGKVRRFEGYCGELTRST